MCYHKKCVELNFDSQMSQIRDQFMNLNRANDRSISKVEYIDYFMTLYAQKHMLKYMHGYKAKSLNLVRFQMQEVQFIENK